MDVNDDSVHSTVAGLQRAEALGDRRPSALRGNPRSFTKLTGSLRRSLPRIAKSSQNLRGKSASASSLSSGGRDTSASRDSGAHRTFSRAEGRSDGGKPYSHQHDAGSVFYGVAQAPGKKDQDRYDVRLGGETGDDTHYFGVFDGHGTSALAADLCVSQLYEAVAAAQAALDGGDGDDGASDLSSSLGSRSSQQLSGEPRAHEPMPMPDDAAIVRGFLRVDALVKASRQAEPRSGACAVALWTQAEPPENLLEAADDDARRETAVKVAWAGDCRAMLISQSGEVDELTQDHRAGDNEAERERVLAADHKPREGLLGSELWRREQERAARTGEKLRPHSFIARRQLNGVPMGPECVFSHSGGVSLQVTRSIGDAYAARSVVAEPEVVSFTIARGEFARFVLASDGVFDVMDEQDVAKFVAKLAAPAKAAVKLAAHAKQKRLYAGMASDDITVIVVDLNPEMRKHFKAAALSKGRLRGAF